MTTQSPALRRRRAGLASAALLAVLGGSMAAPAVAAPPAPEVPVEPLITTTSTWHYLDDGSDPSPAPAGIRDWTAPEFDDSAWPSAPGSFGAKNGRLDRVGPHTPTTLLNHYLDGVSAPTVPTYFFRTSFDLAEGVADQVASLRSTITYDDAIVVWVNGVKVASYVDGRISETTNVEYAGDSNGDPVSSTFSADADVLRDGRNTVAVALHQDRDNSSDIYFDMSSLALIPASEPGQPVVAPPTRIVLTPTETPSTSQSFSWLAGDASHTTGQVQIVPSSGGETRTVDAYSAGVAGSNPNQHFSATVDALAPATEYDYRVGLEGSWSDWFTFRTEDPNATDFQFVYYGDAQIGLDSTWPSVVAQAEATAPRSIGSVHAGDLINTSGNDTEWMNWFLGMQGSAVSTNVMAAPGNHEYSGDKTLSTWKANFEYPRNNPSVESIGELADLAKGESDVARQYAAYFAHWAEFATETVYYTDYQDVRFITLNATRDTTFLTPNGLPGCSGDECPSARVAELWTKFQAAWLDGVLENSPSKWNVVTFHQPVFSTSAGRDEPILRAEWVPVFQDNDIDLVLMGHDHTYARGYVDTDATETAGITTGPVYVVSNSGAKHYELESDEKNVWTNNGATQVIRGAGVTTYQVIDVSEDQLVYRSYLAEKTADATTELPVGAVYDEFTVTKDDAGRKWVTEAGITPPTDPEPESPGEIALSARTIAVGGELMVSGSGFPAGAELALELRSTPVSLGSVTVDEDGAFAQAVTIPADTVTGAHTLAVILPDGSEVTAEITVTAADENAGPGQGGGADGGAADGAGSGGSVAEGDLAITGADSTALITGALVLLALGLGLFAMRRRLRTHD
ncbi:phosphodiesterase/alkaline phosphatase D-like protein [Microbacterium ginsengiterrae]|uniref:Phosphodiesterase/alkaline phosphatase D-like protein n=1 Tax=Microbacterium ginsengiterrae TaxID=546115 RepID=A0A7W9CBS6_9MICO|nr:FN3 domain-containing metallophosphoesterase family protein [Microbacterium ginsengiterrae]MBB5742703.1 phosphodiesterase/alkaline phosphatase D-like protein [Microbacterium ginsengiterrae]